MHGSLYAVLYIPWLTSYIYIAIATVFKTCDVVAVHVDQLLTSAFVVKIANYLAIAS